MILVFSLLSQFLAISLVGYLMGIVMILTTSSFSRLTNNFCATEVMLRDVILFFVAYLCANKTGNRSSIFLTNVKTIISFAFSFFLKSNLSKFLPFFDCISFDIYISLKILKTAYSKQYQTVFL